MTTRDPRMRPLLPGARLRLRSALLLLLLCAAAAPSSAQSQAPVDPSDPLSQIDPATGQQKKNQKPPPVSLTVLVGHDNSARLDQPTPVRVVLDNNDKAVAGRIELRDFSGHITDMPYELPRSGHKEYTLFAQLRPDENHSQRASGEVVVLDGRRVLAKQALYPKYLDTNPLILSVSDEGKNLLFLNEDRRDQFDRPGRHYQVAPVSPQDLPRQWPGYNPADVVAMSGRSWSQMDNYQRRAFRMWVERGGRALLWGETTAEWRDAEAQALCGVVARDLVSLPSLHCVARWGGVPFHARAGKLLTVSGPLQPGSTTQIAEAGRPLVVTREALQGRVLWIGFDPLREGFRQWPGYASFWRATLEKISAGPSGAASEPLENVEEAKAAVNSLPRLPAPPMGAIIAFGVMYAFIFGPLNIWMLRRMRRTVRSWLFMPSLAVTMTLVVLVLGQTWGSGRTVLNSISILRTASGARTATEDSLVGLFSPTNRAFDITVEDPAPGFRDAAGAEASELASNLRLHWPHHQSDGVVRWDAVALQLYSTRVLAQTRPRDLGGAIEVSLGAGEKLGGTLAGTVRNGTNLSLRRAYLQRRGEYCLLGDIGAGSEAAIDGKGWLPKLPEPRGAATPAGELQENRQFRESIARLWATAAAALAPERAREELWLVAECADYPGSLEVASVPYNNRAGLLLVRVTQRPEQL